MRALGTIVAILLLPSLLGAATASASELEGVAEPAVAASPVISSPYYLVLASSGAESLELGPAPGLTRRRRSQPATSAW